MPTSNRGDTERERTVNQIIADYLRSVEAGKNPDHEKLLLEHPEFADELRSFFADHERFQKTAEHLKADSASYDVPTLDSSPPRVADLLPRIRYFGDYELLEEIARGGMGVVYRARQVSLNRIVAVKMILAGQLASADEVRRFHQEAEAAANLDHPQIVPIYEVGEHDGQHYFSMKLIEGSSLSQSLRQHPQGMPRREAVELLATVARAVHHAHQRGLLHRDLKPGNILLDSEGQPHVTDFGLARRVEGDSDLTRSGAVVGTPTYMAPEQARAEKQLTTAVDIYSLGAILYELLSGRPPFRAESPVETMMQVLSQEPESLHSLDRRLDRDLDTIALKCLEKEPARRYDSAAALADDLDRWLRSEPILARSAGKIERMVKWIRRRPAIAGLSAALLIVALAGVGLVTWKWREASERSETERIAKESERVAKEGERSAKGKLQKALEISQEHAFQANLSLVANVVDHDPARATAILDDNATIPPEKRDFAWHYYRRLSLRHLSTVEPEGTNYKQWTEGALGGNIMAAAIAPDCQRFAFDNHAGEIRLSMVSSGKSEAILPAHGKEANPLLFSPDGKLLATGGRDGLVKLWEVPGGKLVATLTWTFDDPVPRSVMSLAFSPDGKTLAVGGAHFDVNKDKKDPDGRYHHPVIWKWDVASRQGKALTMLSGRPAYEIDNNGIYCLSWSPDAKTIAAGLTRAGTAVVFDAETGTERKRLSGEGGWVEGVAFNGGSKLLAYSNSAGMIFLYDSASGQTRPVLHRMREDVEQLRFARNGSLVSGSNDGRICIWNVDSGECNCEFWCAARIRALGFSEDGQQVVAVTERDVQTWLLEPISHSTKLRDSTSKTPDRGSTVLAFDDAGKFLAVGGQDETVRIWDISERKLIHKLTGAKKPASALIFTEKGNDLLVSADDKDIILWRLNTPSVPTSMVLAGHSGTVSCFATTPDGKLLLSGSLDSTLRLWDLPSGKLSYVWKTDHKQIYCLAIRADGEMMITGGNDGSLRVWDLPGRKLLSTPEPRRWLSAPVNSVGFVPGQNSVFTVQAQVIGYHSIDTLGQLKLLHERGRVAQVAFTPDGTSMVWGYDQTEVRVMHTKTGLLVADLPGHTHMIRAMTFSRDGTKLATASFGLKAWDQRGEVLVWEAPIVKDQSKKTGE